MAGFIEEFYYCNIAPQARSTEANKQLQKEMRTLSKNEDLLSEKLSGEEKDFFLDYVNAWGIVNGESNLDSFIVGFRLGAKFAYDTFVSEKAPCIDYFKEK